MTPGDLQPVNVALYGSNGHQVQELVASNPRARLVAIAAFPRENLPPVMRADADVRSYPTIDALLADDRVELVSLCSPRRCAQADEAIRSLRAGKHVYAEKPAAFTEPELDAILRTATETGCLFREMADTAFCQPYRAMREIVQAGQIGRVVQITAEKSYPYHDRRPQDEMIDGGLIRQCAIHALRFVEHVAGVRVRSVQARETSAANPVAGGGLRMAACLSLGLENGGLASITANYLNPKGTGMWGYETLRIFGDLGLVESTQGGQQTRLVIGACDCGPLALTQPSLDYFSTYLDAIRGRGVMPLTSEEELSPLRWAIRAKHTL